MWNKNFSLSINWAVILSASIFWVWGLCAYSGGSLANSLFVDIVVLCFFCYLNFQRNTSLFLSKVRFSTREATIFIAIAIALFTAVFSHLNQSLWGDQIYHSSLAMRWGQISAIRFGDVLGVSSLTIQYTSLAFSALFLLIFFLIPKLLKLNKYVLTIFLLSCILLVRCGAYKFLLNAPGESLLINPGLDPHPPLRLLPLLFSSAIFGVTDFAFRVVAFAGFIGFLFFLYKKILEISDLSLAIIVTFSVATIPIFLHNSYLVEQSIWGVLASSVVFIWLFSSTNIAAFPLIPSISLIILASLMRSPAFLAAIPLAFITAARLTTRKFSLGELLHCCILFFALSLFVAIGVIRGTPATVGSSFIENFIYAENNNIPAIAAASVLGLYPLFFIGFIFLTTSKINLFRFLITAIFFLVSLAVFYGPVNRILWGVGRYQAEIFIPLIISGIFVFISQVSSRYLSESRFSRYLYVLPLFLLIFINLYSWGNMDNRKFRPFPDNPTPNEAIKSEAEYPIAEAFKYIKEKKLQNNLYYVGIYYGGFISILNGYNSQDFSRFIDLNNISRAGFSVNADEINKNQDILAVMVEPEADSGVLKALTDRGWSGRVEFMHRNQRHKIVVMTR